MMVISSDRPGGTGGHDLWWSQADEEGIYRDFYPLTMANTPGDEMDVSFSSDGQCLYFSSDFCNSVSGSTFKVFALRKDSLGSWRPPIPLAQVNMEGNSRYFFDADSVFYFSSDKAGGKGGYDIYRGWVMSPKPSLKKLMLAAQKKQAQTDTLIVIEKDRYGVMNDILDSAGFTEYYARVQIGAYTNLTVDAFKAANPSLRSTPITIEWVKTDRGRIGKFMVDAKYTTLKEASAVQEEMWNRHHIKDAFIAVYDVNNIRIAIYNSIKGEFILLSPGAKPVVF
jgi:hypothetical protein